MHNHFTNKIILEKLDKLVYGHTNVKKHLISAINRGWIRFSQRYENSVDREDLIPLHRLLILGESGTGKTHLIRSLQSIIGFPLLMLDASKFNVTGGGGGYKINDIKEDILTLASKYCISDPDYNTREEAISKTVVFVDEIDKISTSYDGGSGGGKWNMNVQAELLTMLDGSDFFEDVTFIFAGAFSGLRKDEEKKKSIGFSHNSIDSERKDLDELILNYGVLPEFVGRLTAITELDKFETIDYESIIEKMLLPKALLDMKYFLNYDNDKYTMPNIQELAKLAVKSGQGVRYLKRAISKVFEEIEFNYEIGMFEHLVQLTLPHIGDKSNEK